MVGEITDKNYFSKAMPDSNLICDQINSIQFFGTGTKDLGVGGVCCNPRADVPYESSDYLYFKPISNYTFIIPSNESALVKGDTFKINQTTFYQDIGKALRIQCVNNTFLDGFVIQFLKFNLEQR